MKKLLILLIFIGVLIMFKNINAIIQDSIGNIIYRGNVVTGIVATDNGDKSYDIFISESEKAYPHIFTLSENPNLAVGDKVRILYKNGCKELPIILPPTVAVAGYIFVYCWTALDGYCIKSYTSDGTFIKTVISGPSDLLQNRHNTMCVDSDNNVYYLPPGGGEDLIRKIDKDGNLLLEKSVGYGVGAIWAICGELNGYVYGLEQSTDFPNYNTHVTKRNKSDLALVDKVDIGVTTILQEGFACDSNGYLYIVFWTNWPNYSIRKWSMTGQIASRVYIYPEGLSHVGELVSGIHNQSGSKSAFTMPDTLDENATIWNLDGISIPTGTGSVGNNFLFVGYNNSISAILARYDSNKTKVWETIIGTYNDTTVYQVAAYPF